jgi:hypothetical protein
MGPVPHNCISKQTKHIEEIIVCAGHAGLEDDPGQPSESWLRTAPDFALTVPVAALRENAARIEC